MDPPMGQYNPSLGGPHRPLALKWTLRWASVTLVWVSYGYPTGILRVTTTLPLPNPNPNPNPDPNPNPNPNPNSNAHPKPKPKPDSNPNPNANAE